MDLGSRGGSVRTPFWGGQLEPDSWQTNHDKHLLAFGVLGASVLMEEILQLETSKLKFRVNTVFPWQTHADSIDRYV